jgi:hypothetical protein
MPGLIDYNALAQQLMQGNGLLSNVAQRNPMQSKMLDPRGGTEGAVGYGGGSNRTMPLTEFTNGNIRPTQQSVDPKGVQKYKKRIQSGERPAVEIDPVAGTRFEGAGATHRIVDGHTRLRAYYELGIPDIPVTFYANRKP